VGFTLKHIKKCDLSALLEDNYLSYYWIGFILADGSISKKNELKISVSLKDENHLKKLQEFLKIKEIHYLKTTNGYNYVSIHGLDTEVMKEFCKKFSTGNNKTYNPANINWITDEKLMLSLIAGFIDGDGCIDNQFGRPDFKLRIKCHNSWLPVLVEFIKFIYMNEAFEPVQPKINKSGYAELTVTNTVILKNLKKKILNLKLPIMNRKWEIIDLNYISRNENAEYIKKQVIQLLLDGKKNKQICQILNVHKSTVSIIKKNYLSSKNL